MSFESDLENWRRIERELAQKLVIRDIIKLEYAPKTTYKDWDLKVTYEDEWKICEKTFEVKDVLGPFQTSRIGTVKDEYGNESRGVVGLRNTNINVFEEV